MGYTNNDRKLERKSNCSTYFIHFALCGFGLYVPLNNGESFHLINLVFALSVPERLLVAAVVVVMVASIVVVVGGDASHQLPAVGFGISPFFLLLNSLYRDLHFTIRFFFPFCSWKRGAFFYFLFEFETRQFDTQLQCHGQ